MNRLSFGVQSLVGSVLGSLGRHHSAANVYRAVEYAADAGFARSYSVDLIYGAAGERLADWQAKREQLKASIEGLD